MQKIETLRQLCAFRKAVSSATPPSCLGERVKYALRFPSTYILLYVDYCYYNTRYGLTEQSEIRTKKRKSLAFGTTTAQNRIADVSLGRNPKIKLNQSNTIVQCKSDQTPENKIRKGSYT